MAPPKNALADKARRIIIKHHEIGMTIPKSGKYFLCFPGNRISSAIVKIGRIKCLNVEPKVQ